MREPKMKRSEKGWYEIWYDECLLCGRTRIAERIKRPFPKPEDWHERNHVSEGACSSHFL